MKFHIYLALFLGAFTSLAQVLQDQARVVSTAAELVSKDPAYFSASTVGTNTTYLSVVTTTGSTVPLAGEQVWGWSPASGVATNTAALGGPLAYPYGAAFGRWILIPGSGTTTVNVDSGLIPVALVANMIALAPAQLSVAPVFVRTAGRLTAGVGGATFYWDPASIAATNLGTCFAHTSLPGRFIYAEQEAPSVDLFGAIPDFFGVDNGDDRQAFTNAYETLPIGAKLRMSMGTYRAVGITNLRAISLIGVKASHPTKLSADAGESGFPAWGLGSEIEANGDGWILTHEGRPNEGYGPAPDNETFLQPAEVAYVSFFGDKRTRNVGGIRIANADNQYIHNCNFYVFKKAAIWAQRTMRESLIEYNDIRYCGDADAVDSPDPVKGWAAIMNMDELPTVNLMGDQSNFNLWRANQVSYSLGCALIVDSKNIMTDNGVVFDERFVNNIWHGYANYTNLAYYSEFVSTANKMASPLVICRATDRPSFNGDHFWFSGSNASHIVFENNTTATNTYTRSTTGAERGTLLGNVANCKFYGNFNAGAVTPMVWVKAGSRASVINGTYYGNGGQVTLLNEGTPNDTYIRHGRMAIDEVAVSGTAAVTGRLTASAGALVGPMTTAEINALSGKTLGLHMTDSTVAKPAWWNGSTLKYLAFEGSSGGGSGDATVLDSMADMIALTNTPSLVWLRGYHAASPGVGYGFWGWFPTETRATNRAVVKPTTAGSGRYLPIFENGRIDITRFGARNNVTDDTAVMDALSMQQDNTWPDKILFVPVGNYQILSQLTNSTSTRFYLQGINQGIGNSNNGILGTSRLTMMTDETNICYITGAGNVIENISLVFNTIHYDPQTNAACIKHNQVADLSRSRFSNIHMAKGGFGFVSRNTSSVYNQNNIWENILVDRYSFAAMWFGAAGTTSKLTHFYIQNLQNDVAVRNDSQTITAVSKSGAEITLTVANIPTGLTTNCFFFIENDQVNADYVEVGGSANNTAGYRVCKYATGNTVKFDMNSDPGGSAVLVGSPTITFAPKPASGRAALYLGANFEYDANSIDVENTMHPGGCLVWNEGFGTIGNLHSEFTYSTTAAFHPLRNRGAWVVNSAVIMNTGAPTGVTGGLILNQDGEGATGANTMIGLTKVTQLTVRDLANIGNTMTYGSYQNVTNQPVRIERFRDAYTFRANATSTLSLGNATLQTE